MVLGWNEIERALDLLISNEEGFRFQRLAVALAKHKWPFVVATEIHLDGGEDALTHPFLTQDGKRFDIACSLTPDYGKIKGDANRIKSRGVQLDLLVFYTPRKVSNVPTVEDWQRDFRREYGWELFIVSREDIIQDLLKPENQWMCREFLGLTVPSEPSVADIARRAAQGAAELVQQWRRYSRLSETFLLELDIVSSDLKDPSRSAVIEHAAICRHLCKGSRIVLTGAPGAGKTTTLIQLSEKLLTTSERAPLLVSLPEWVDSQDDILAFATHIPVVAAAGLSVQDLHLLHKNGKLVFLLNGWNEVDSNLMARAARKLQWMDRDLPAAGIIVATREHAIYPPLVGRIDLRIRGITDLQRETLIRTRAPQSADHLLRTLQTNETLSDLTQTPMILAEVIRIFQAAERVPQTKLAVLRHLVHRIEDLDEHRVALQSAPLSRRSEEYLSNIAAGMTRDGRTVVHEDTILPVISAVSRELIGRGLIGAIPDPNTVLNTLCAHHVLERSIYPRTSIRFFHQQFQELYAAEFLLGELTARGSAEAGDREFSEGVINIPSWEEPLTLLVADLCSLDRAAETGVSRSTDHALAQHLINLVIPIDPIFAAGLVRASGLWQEVKDVLEPLLRSWYGYECHEHQDCALAAMLATGAPAFADIIWALLEDPDYEVRCRVYRAHQSDWLSCLGEDWINRVEQWDGGRRGEFISELGLGRSRILEIFEAFTKNDPSVQVRVKALDQIAWCYGRSAFWQAVREADESTLKEALREEVVRGTIPSDLQPRVSSAYKELLQESSIGRERFLMAVQASRTNVSGMVDVLQRELESVLSTAEAIGNETIRLAVKIICETDADYASVWAAQAIARGQVAPHYLLDFVDRLPNGLVATLLKRYCQLDLTSKDEWQVQDLLAKGMEIQHIRDVLRMLIRLDESFRASGPPIPDAQRELYHRLRNLVRKVSWQGVIDCIVKGFSTLQGTSDLHIILDVLGYSNLQSDQVRPPPDGESLPKLRSLLRGTYYDAVCKDPDQDGHLKADFACAIALFGEPCDLSLLQDLIQRDIARFEVERETCSRTHVVPTCWSHCYLDAVCRFGPDLAEGVLIDLLGNPYYAADAGRGLIKLLNYTRQAETKSIWRPLPELDFERREQGLSHLGDNEKRRAYAGAVLNTINSLREEQGKSDDPDRYNGRLKEMASILAVLGESDTVPLILDIMALPEEWNNWRRVDTLGILVRNGYTLNYDAVARVLDPVIARIIKRHASENQDDLLLRRCLCIFLFTNKPAHAVVRLQELEAHFRRLADTRELITALGKSNCKEAIDYLIVLAQRRGIPDYILQEFVDALVQSRFPEAHDALINVLDPTAPEPKMHLPLRSLEIFTFARSVADLCRTDTTIRQRVLALCSTTLSDPQRSCLAEIVNALSDEEAVLAGLNLIADGMQNPIPFGLRQAIENRLLDKVPVKDWPNAYEEKPRCDTVLRRHLFGITVGDPKRCESALELLGQARLWRLEYGMPLLEPRHPHLQTGVPWPPPMSALPRQHIPEN